MDVHQLTAICLAAPDLVTAAALRARVDEWLVEMNDAENAITWALATFGTDTTAFTQFHRERQSGEDLSHWLLDLASDLEDEAALRGH